MILTKPENQPNHANQKSHTLQANMRLYEIELDAWNKAKKGVGNK